MNWRIERQVLRRWLPHFWRRLDPWVRTLMVASLLGSLSLGLVAAFLVSVLAPTTGHSQAVASAVTPATWVAERIDLVLTFVATFAGTMAVLQWRVARLERDFATKAELKEAVIVAEASRGRIQDAVASLTRTVEDLAERLGRHDDLISELIVEMAEQRGARNPRKEKR